MKEGKLNRNDQKTLKTLAKILEVISKIGEALLYVSMVFVTIGLFVVPVILKNIEVKNDKLVLSLNEQYTIEENEGKISLFNDDKRIVEEKSDVTIAKYKEIIKNNNKKRLISAIQIELVLSIVYMWLLVIVFKSANKLFKNIGLSTPFTLENIELLKKMFKYLISSYALSILTSIIFGLITGVNVSGTSINFVTIVVIIVNIYIFKYGYELEKDSKGNIYDEAE